jgi:hypothetical protein
MTSNPQTSQKRPDPKVSHRGQDSPGRSAVAVSGAPAGAPRRAPHVSQKSLLPEWCPAEQVGMFPTPVGDYFLVLMVLVDLVSSVISSTSSTFRFSRSLGILQ